MNTDDIIKLARDAAAKHGQELNESPEPEIVAFLVEFHTLVTQAERDACAIAAVIHSQYPITTDYDKGYDAGRRNAAQAIRARNHIVDANKMDCTDCDCADNEPCKRTAPGLALESGEFVPAEKITEKLKCWCTTCRPITPCNARFVVCPECGNKRCPKAHNHELTCTNSNDVGQQGSSWEHVKPFAQNNDPEDKTDWAAA